MTQVVPLSLSLLSLSLARASFCGYVAKWGNPPQAELKCFSWHRGTEPQNNNHPVDAWRKGEVPAGGRRRCEQGGSVPGNALRDAALAGVMLPWVQNRVTPKWKTGGLLVV